MKRILVTSTVCLDDVILCEPTLEALYYHFAPCELWFRTYEGYFPFFEHHPLITGLLAFEKDVAEQINAPVDVHIRLPEIAHFQHWPISDVQKIALGAFRDEGGMSTGVRLLRHTPKIFLDLRPPDWHGVAVAGPTWGADGWPNVRSVLSNIPHTRVASPKTPDETREALKMLASASLVVGADGWMTHAAAALSTRVVMGMTEEQEWWRRPHNVVVARPEDEDVCDKINTTWSEPKYPDYLNTGNAADFIKNKAKEYMKSGFVDVGCSAWPLPNAIPVDKRNRKVIDEAADETFHGVFSSHCLEHIKNATEELRLWHRILKRNGILFLYLPHPHCEPWHAMTGSWVGSEHVWNPEPVTLVKFLREQLDFNILEYTSRQDSLWSFYVIARKR